MSPEPEPASDPAELMQLKEGILERWRRMPPDEAAAIMVEQLREAMGRGLITAPETDPRFKPFVAVSICRADMINHFTNQEIARFDDKDMRKLAALMGDWYRDESFWHDLKTIGGIILEEKEQGRGSTFGSG